MSFTHIQANTVEGFHTKGWTKFFSVQISTFWSQKIIKLLCFIWFCMTPGKFWVKFGQVNLKARIQATMLFKEKICISLKWCLMAICNLYQWLVYFLEMFSWCIRQFSWKHDLEESLFEFKPPYFPLYNFWSKFRKYFCMWTRPHPENQIFIIIFF